MESTLSYSPCALSLATLMLGRRATQRHTTPLFGGWLVGCGDKPNDLPPNRVLNTHVRNWWGWTIKEWTESQEIKWTINYSPFNRIAEGPVNWVRYCFALFSPVETGPIFWKYHSSSLPPAAKEVATPEHIVLLLGVLLAVLTALSHTIASRNKKITAESLNHGVFYPFRRNKFLNNFSFRFWRNFLLNIHWIVI